MLQDTHLFTGTVMENIRYGRLAATDEECIEAAKLANADGFTTRLPDGYNLSLIHILVTVGSFPAGTRCNIIAQDAVLEGTLRAFDDDVHRRLLEHFKRIITDVSAAYGCTCLLYTSRCV